MAEQMAHTKTDEHRWDALKARDANAAGRFLYAVKTTGVYCRPGCSSRLPKRINVEFFDSASAAQRAGYRPCKRCHPEGPSNGEITTQLVERACRMIERADDAVTLAELAANAAMSAGHFQRVFKGIVGLTPRRYAATHRTQRFRAGLRAEDSVTKAIYSAGYGSSSRAYEGVARRLGMSPANFRNGAPGQTIRYAITKCYLGFVLVAATGKGICAIEFGNDRNTLAAQLRGKFPKAEVRLADKGFASTVDAVVALLENPARGLNLPLDIQGTAFQQRVWTALQKVPPGETVSYTEVAERIGSPRAARAVAAACASNRLAVAVPCHRVVRATGAISRYRWGVDRKQELLRREGVTRADKERRRSSKTKRR
jgi:AraC family transcriptional regulator, regulatory protein of adaptative response / methylated-DNA-[protein]-cysteine methyltransferase